VDLALLEAVLQRAHGTPHPLDLLEVGARARLDGVVSASTKCEPPSGSTVSATPVSCREHLLRAESIRAPRLRGEPERSSIEFVWSDCVPPSTAASAW
jgi:hypothetical protein